eukprot:TRINITY_DN63610_c0_g1_i1.p1 TRINITY_DN63610_c0_g1~~TRINITY_DN63610_c0_g1_i1.p1  ORF type:complete len:379 (+),score=17.55 TRINITY_DN63610_c0_g1_i1:23-1159(+)
MEPDPPPPIPCRPEWKKRLLRGKYKHLFKDEYHRHVEMWVNSCTSLQRRKFRDIIREIHTNDFTGQPTSGADVLYRTYANTLVCPEHKDKVVGWLSNCQVGDREAFQEIFTLVGNTLGNKFTTNALHFAPPHVRVPPAQLAHHKSQMWNAAQSKQREIKLLVRQREEEHQNIANELLGLSGVTKENLLKLVNKGSSSSVVKSTAASTVVSGISAAKRKQKPKRTTQENSPTTHWKTPPGQRAGQHVEEAGTVPWSTLPGINCKTSVTFDTFQPIPVENGRKINGESVGVRRPGQLYERSWVSASVGVISPCSPVTPPEVNNMLGKKCKQGRAFKHKKLIDYSRQQGSPSPSKSVTFTLPPLKNSQLPGVEYEQGIRVV